MVPVSLARVCKGLGLGSEMAEAEVTGHFFNSDFLFSPCQVVEPAVYYEDQLLPVLSP
jgi:hypothetical protein